MKPAKIGPKIKAVRQSEDLTQEELAKILGYSHKSVITHIEKGDTDMTYDKIQLLINELNVDANELFDVNNAERYIKEKFKIKRLFFNSSNDYLKRVKEIDYHKYFGSERISFKPVTTEEDLIYCCFCYDLTTEQEEMVNPPYFSIARAYLNPHSFYPFIITLKDDTKIGFIMLNKWIGEVDAFSFSLLIDKNYQHKGYGKEAIKLAISLFRDIDSKKEIRVAVEQDNKKAQDLYSSLGFKKLNELDGDDFIFAL